MASIDRLGQEGAAFLADPTRAHNHGIHAPKPIAEAIHGAGAGLRSLGEPWADTTSPAGRMVLTDFAGIAEFERALIHQRTSSGRAAAKQRGVRFGRPPKLTAEQIALARRLTQEGTSVPEVAAILGVHVATLYRAFAAQPSIPAPGPSAANPVR